MILIDANLLLHAYHPASPMHASSRGWLEKALTDAPVVGLAWQTIWAFVRIITNPRIFERPLSASEAVGIVASWLAQPNVTVLGPGERHWSILADLLQAAQCTGPLVADATLAAIAIEHGADLQTTDRDFARFQELKWLNPLA